MANLFTDTKNKIQDLFIYLVSCGKSSNEPSRNDQEAASDGVPLGNDLGQKVYVPLEVQAGPAGNHVPPRRNAQGQGHVVVIGEPTNIPPGKSSKKPSGIHDQELARDAPLGDDLGLKVFIPEDDQDAGVPPRNAQGQGHIIVLQPGNNTQNQGQPTINIPPVEENIEQQGQGLDESSQEQKQKQEETKNDDDDDIEPLPFGFIPEERANFSRPPGRRSAPIPKTG